jgi:hypothetical protein
LLLLFPALPAPQPCHPRTPRRGVVGGLSASARGCRATTSIHEAERSCNPGAEHCPCSTRGMTTRNRLREGFGTTVGFCTTVSLFPKAIELSPPNLAQRGGRGPLVLLYDHRWDEAARSRNPGAEHRTCSTRGMTTRNRLREGFGTTVGFRTTVSLFPKAIEVSPPNLAQRGGRGPLGLRSRVSCYDLHT